MDLCKDKEVNVARVSLAGLLTHRCYEKKLKVKPTMVKVEEEVSKLGEAHSLYFDGAYKRKVDKAAVGVVIYDEEGRNVSGKGLMLENVHSNNEAEYAALGLGLEWCLNLGIKHLNAFGDALLLVKQVHGTWACRNQGLVVQLCRVKELLKRFEVAHLLHVPRKDNQEANALASEKLQDVTIGAVALQQPQFQGSDCMPDIYIFLKQVNVLKVKDNGWFGVPLEILSDRGPGFRGDLVEELMKKLKIKRRHSTPYYPQCNGLVEKVNELWLELPPETEEDEEKGSSSIPCYEDPEERLEA
ncbi:hypothetical protein L7F22_040745 [Adiantum nelumboides]|nr:hypothetical protein [Adiantum nelumboides]